MAKTTIFVWTSARTAVLSSIQHGWTPIKIDTAMLSQEERELLADSVYENDGARYRDLDEYGNKPLDFENPTLEGLVEHLKSRLKKFFVEEAEFKRIESKVIGFFHDRPIDDFTTEGGSHPYTVPDVAHLVEERQNIFKLSPHTRDRCQNYVAKLTKRERDFDEFLVKTGREPFFSK